MNHTKTIVLFVILALAFAAPSWAQWPSHKSVLSENTWCKIGVTQDGVYAVDYATLQAAGINLGSVNPNRIRLFGNTSGPLPELNSEDRFDDLTEIPIQVLGADDGSFDAQDRVLFYGKGPVNMVMGDGYYSYNPNPYTDSIFYFLCVDGDKDGLRIQENPSNAAVSSDAVIDKFLDYKYHESEEFSPYASGRTWYGDLFTKEDGVKTFSFSVPGLVKTELCRIESKVLGRCETAFQYDLSINGNNVIDQYTIQKFGDYNYGKEHRASRTFSTDSEKLVIRYKLYSATNNPLMFIDYFVLNFWRELRFRGDDMAFGIFPQQVPESTAKVQIEDAGPEVLCWDVTDPIYPCQQTMDYEGGKASFNSTTAVGRQFFLFKNTGLKSVASCRRIPNQNLHGVKDADMLIITPKVFWNQSEALAEFHREEDGMNCVLADVQEIYNEFGTGVQDITAIRDFIRMVYLRSKGHLKYVLLMGKGTHDYRDIKGLHNNFVPTYETLDRPVDEVSSMCTDDYYGLMDEGEGLNCTGKVDLGIGRIPITTPEKGDDVVAKIKHYTDITASHGIWKNDHLFMADNDNNTYPDHADKLDYILDTSWRTAMTKKLYTDTYQVVKTADGERIPEANAKLLDYFNKGISVLSYTGHGGVKSLSAEYVLGVSDILALNNYDHLSFVHTATCEFSKFDNPNVVSGGELLMLNSHGGAIALLTTVRPTSAPNNLEMSKSLHAHLYHKDAHQPLRFGDIYRLAKSDPRYYKKDNIVYVLFGDPALRFSYPSEEIKTTSGSVTSGLGFVEGYIEGINSTVDAAFNGIVEVKVYDSRSNYTTLTTDYDYSFYNDVLYEGKASVKNGRFSLQFPIPENNNQGLGFGRVSLYAYDSVRKVDANGVFDELLVEASDVVDDQGPDIHLYWNSPDFESGDVVSRRGVLYADLFDEHGIYHYNASIGRDIVLRSNVSGYENVVLNESYEPALDDYQRGSIVLPFEDFEDGTYEFVLKAWDTYNNATEVEIFFTVSQGAIVAQLRNYPNPFIGDTWFTFVHGDMTDQLSVTIEVFDMMGRQVAFIEQETQSDFGQVPPIHWDGSALHPGIYVYRITVTNSRGKSRTVSQRMVKK